jgi:hypothetical protein
MDDEGLREWLVAYISIYKWGDIGMDRRELIWSILLYPIAAPICLLILGMLLLLKYLSIIE